MDETSFFFNDHIKITGNYIFDLSWAMTTR
jgi:hypothetical protein